ncbi:MAG: preprotein translocase subunit SecE [Deltaproteobacteria bacterium]
MDKIANLSSDTVQFAKDIENEAKRITWPSRNETVKSTLAVIVISAIFASFLGLVDYIFSIGIKFLLS